MKKILVINGPNLNLLGQRDESHYGADTLEGMNEYLKEKVKGLDVTLSFYQSNIEGEIIDKIHTVIGEYDGCVINAGGYTHYSVAIRDAIDAVKKPFVEVHLSSIHKREEFRHVSMLTPVCVGQISGFGKDSYLLAIRYLCEYQNN